MPKAILVVNADWFFLSHRLPIALALRNAGWEVLVAAGDTGERGTIERHGLRFAPLPIKRGGRNPIEEAVTVGALLRLYTTERPDVVHHVTVKPVLYGTFAARITRVPCVLNAISGLGFVFIEREQPSVRDHTVRSLIRAAYRGLLHDPRIRVIFQNPTDREMFLRERFVNEDQAVLIRGSGVDLDVFHPSPLPEGIPVVLLPARLLWDKGVGEFVEAARELRRDGIRARFALVGRIDQENPAGIDAGQIDAWVRDGIVEWWGARPREQMPETYAAASLVVLPSYREGLPLSLVEAAACGRAAATTDVPGCRDVVREGENGWLVPVRNAGALARAIRDALSARDELVCRGERARARAEREFSIDAIVQQTLALYPKMRGGQSAGPPGISPASPS
jgi:glycosyltransferase involved in cell wall biosynthesis